jgi:hypothetical protein
VRTKLAAQAFRETALLRQQECLDRFVKVGTTFDTTLETRAAVAAAAPELFGITQ